VAFCGGRFYKIGGGGGGGGGEEEEEEGSAVAGAPPPGGGATGSGAEASSGDSRFPSFSCLCLFPYQLVINLLLRRVMCRQHAISFSVLVSLTTFHW
jgi:hypothetical protein